MKELEIKLENCYGISKLEQKFDFSVYKTNLVYAPNGAMKSSLAKIFSSYQHGKKNNIRDEIFTDKHPGHSIRADGNDIDPKTIFVIKPFEDSFFSQNITDILLREEYKEKYEEIIFNLKRNKEAFLLKLGRYFEYIKTSNEPLDALDAADMKKINQFTERGGIEKLFVKLFTEREYNSEIDFYEAVLRIYKELLEKVNCAGDFSDIKYGLIFNDKSTELLEKLNQRSLLEKYVQKYKQLIEDSKYFSLKFTHTNAEKLIAEMEDVNYFDAQAQSTKDKIQNGFQLYNKKSDVRDPKERDELLDEIKKLKKALTTDADFSGHYVAINTALDGKRATKIVKKFKNSILDPMFNLNFLVLLSQGDLDDARRELIFSYLKDCIADFRSFADSVDSSYQAITELSKKFKDDKDSLWHDVVREFNERFRVPFIVAVSDADKDKVLMNELKLESLEYYFCRTCGVDANRICNHSKENMIQVNRQSLVGNKEDSILSQGERRAFYLLNVIFEIKYRKERGLQTLFIIDDIADSFDYQNKYAITEYLKEISEVDCFRSIILTHNFDFYRTLINRLEIKKEPGDWFYLAEKKSSEIILVSQKDKNINNPFKKWINELESCDLAKIKYVYVSILMMRNIIDYSGIYESCRDEINDLVHGRTEDFENIEMVNIENLLKKINPKINLDRPVKNRKFLELMKETVASIVKSNSLDLEDKIMVSFYLRLATERYLRSLGYTQKTLREQLEKAESDLLDGVKRLKRVNLITPEHIHINSFMYEPLIDLDKNQIMNLYEDVVKVWGN